MNLSEVYDRINNPLNVNTVERLIQLYSKSSLFYSGLTAMNNVNRDNHSSEDYDKFHNGMFNEWKRQLLSITEEQAKVLYEKSIVDKDFIPLRNFVKNNKDINTEREFLNLIYKDDKIQDIYDKYRWDSLDPMGFWTFVRSSSLVYLAKPTYMKTEHRLYVNTSGKDIYKFAVLFRNKCLEKDLPFDFKISDSPARDDKMVIFTDTEHLGSFLKVLYELKKENPDIMARMNEPPILSGKIGFVGYGSEPLKLNGKHRSFNEVRSEVIENTIEEKLISWYVNNRNLKQGDCTLEEALVKETTRYIINEMTKRFNNSIEFTSADCKKKGIPFSESSVERTLGYGRRDIDSPKLYESVKNAVRNQGLKYLYDGTLFHPKDMGGIEIPLPSGQKYYAFVTSIRNVMKTSLPGIMKFDKNFVLNVLNGIKSKCVANGIDPDKFCFDLDKKDMFFNRTSVKSSDKENEPVASNNGKKLTFPTFDEIRELALKYSFKFDGQKREFIVIDNKTGTVVNDQELSQNAFFANVWLSSAGVKYLQNEIKPGMAYAFNEGARATYEYFVKASTYSVEKTGDLSSLFLFKNASKLDYSHSEEIIARLFGQDYQSDFLDRYVHARVNSTHAKNKKAITLGSLERAYSLLSDQMQNNKSKK